MKNKRVGLRRRIFVSSPRDEYLDARRNGLKRAIIEAIRKHGYEPQMFGSPDGGLGLAAGRSWSPDDADRVMRRCVGAAILGFPIWTAVSERRSTRLSLVSEYNHYEAALAWSHGLPILSVLEEGYSAATCAPFSATERRMSRTTSTNTTPTAAETVNTSK